MSAKTTKKQLGRPSEVGSYVTLIRETPKGETVTVGNLSLGGTPFKSHQAASYRRQTVLSKFGKSAGKNTVAVEKAQDGFYLVLQGRAKSA
jgi:hypothetical protein